MSVRRRAWVISSVGLLLGCASGGDQATTTAASLGDAGSTAASSDGSADTSASTSDSATGMSTPTTSGLDSSGSDSNPTSETTASTPTECDEDPAACTAWLLPNGSGQWIPQALDTDSTLAPSDTVRAAFDIESELEGFVLTDTRLHVVDMAARQWTRTEDRANVLPELGADEILVAYTVPSEWGAMFGGDPNIEGVTFISATTIYLYEYTIDTQTFSFSQSITDFGSGWDAPAAPTKSEMRAAWLDVTNESGWYEGDIMQLCGVQGEPGPYSAIIAASDVHLGDAGYCFEFADPVALNVFAPFTLPNAPLATDVGAALYNETLGLWVFRGS